MNLIGVQGKNERKKRIYVKYLVVIEIKNLGIGGLSPSDIKLKYSNTKSKIHKKLIKHNTILTLSLITMMDISQPQNLKAYGYIKKKK